MQENLIGSISLYDMMIYYFVYGFLGWCLEVAYSTLKTGKFINRGFLNGPFCPIYGVGMAVCVLLLNTLTEKWLLLFVVGAVFASVLELITGFVLERVFKTKWWDYSKEHFNFKGYICLKFSLLWGIAILVVFKTLVPLTDGLIGVLPYKLGLVLLTVLWVLFVSDFVATLIQLSRLNESLKLLTSVGEKLHIRSDKLGEKIFDLTVSVNEKLNLANERIKKSRLGKAFPAIQSRAEELKEKLKENIDKIKKR